MWYQEWTQLFSMDNYAERYIHAYLRNTVVQNLQEKRKYLDCVKNDFHFVFFPETITNFYVIVLNVKIYKP